MLAMDSYTYYNVIAVLVAVHIKYLQGQTYSLSGSPSYGIRGEDYRFTCQISGGNFISNDIIKFSRGNISICRQVLACVPGSSSDTRYTCGCINGDNSTLYLNITNVQSTDAGTWKCGDAFNIGSSSPVTLPVYYGPENIRFTPTSSSIAVIENESRAVTCSANCNPPPCNINWYKGSTIISSTGLLSLNNIQRQQGGNYTCQVTNTQIPDSLQSKQLMVIVHYGPENTRFTPTSSTVTVIGNESRTVTCSADCNPPPCNINWYKGSTIISSTGRLSLNKIQRQQGGNYTCQVTNTQIPASLQSKQLIVIVHYPPSITGFTSDATNNMVDKDSIVTLACTVDSLPSSVISWYRSQQGEQLYSGSPYTIPKASCQHTDNYTCTANNNIGQPVSKTIPLYVRCIPVLDTNQETKTSIFVPHGETGVLTIHVLAYPLPVYSWYYQLQDGSKQLITDFRTTQTDTGLSSTLTIQDVTEDDGGKYIVYVNNSLGTRSTVFNLVVSSQDTDVNGCNNMLGVGIAIGMGISVVVVGVVTALAWVVLKGSGRRFCAKENDQRVVKDTASHDTGLDNIILSDTPHVYDQVNTVVTHTGDTVNTGVTNTRDTVNTGVIETNTTESTNTCTDYINTSTTSPYEELDKQTIDQQPNTYQQLSPYQNLTGDSN